MTILQLSTSALFLSLACGAWDLSPAKLATVARLDLAASFPVTALDDGAVISGNGSIARQSWLPEKDWPLTYTVQVPIVRFAWNEFAVRFVPEKSGTVHEAAGGTRHAGASNGFEVHARRQFWQ